MLISLAYEKPELYLRLFKPNEDVLEEQLDGKYKFKSDTFRDFLKDYSIILKDTIMKKANHNLIGRTSNKSLETVYKLIYDTITDANKLGKKIDVKNLKKDIIRKIQVGKNTRWFHDFWHIFQLRAALQNWQSTSKIEELADFAKETVEVLDEVFSFFENYLKTVSPTRETGIYYNPPIKGLTGADRQVSLNEEARELNNAFLYTDQVPEAPYFLFKTDFLDIPSSATVEVEVEPAKIEVVEEIEAVEEEVGVVAEDVAEAEKIEVIEEVPQATDANQISEIKEGEIITKGEELGSKAKGRNKKTTVVKTTSLETLKNKVLKHP
jgi:hypothetical protein